MLQNTLIATPYETGKGFIESTNDYNDYEVALAECDYLKVIKEVNKIFFKNFTGMDHNSKLSLIEFLFRMVWIPILIFVVMTVSLPFYSFLYE